jgi:2-keto-4-pentenoate hydratase/2-oxohepta-3-ene-1,7-dioic acid hydratase in catechol pathway
MHLVSYRHNQSVSIGLLRNDGIVDLPRYCGIPAGMVSLLGSDSGMATIRERLSQEPDMPGPVPLHEVTLLPPVERPGKIIGVGQNYPAFNQDRRAARQPYPVLFERNADSLVGPGAAIRLPRGLHQVVIECELALVVGRGGKHIPEEKALESLAGYTLANDVTARDLEQRSSQWTSGKLIDHFLPLGPTIVTTDELVDTGNLRMRSWINGQLVQDGVSAEMCFTLAELIAYISTYITLRPGDLILTGSPKRLGDKPVPEVFLRHGDRVRIEIDGLGALENPVEEDQDG